MKYHKVGGLNNRHVLSHCSGSQKSEIKASAGLVPSGSCEGLSPASGGLRAISDVRWLVEALARFLLSSSWGVLFVCSLCVQISPFH